MNAFPALSTGAVMQYPAQRTYAFSTQVIRFVDGSEQRFREFTQPMNRWIVRLDRLNDTELNGLREFFRIQDGAAEPFQFVDPWTGTVYPSCCLETDQMVEVLTDEGRGNTTLIVKENRK